MDIISEEAGNLTRRLAGRCFEIVFTETTITLSIASFALLLNVFIIFTACKKLRIESLPHLYILSYCIADFIFLGVVMPFSIIALIKGRWDTQPLTCYIQGYAAIALGALAAILMTLTAVDRFFAMTSPGIYARLFKGKIVAVVIILCWLIAGAVPLPYFLGNKLKFHPGLMVCKAEVTIENYLTASILQLLVIVVPLFVILLCLCKAKLKMMRRKRQQPGEIQTIELCGNEMTTTRLFTGIILGTLICCLPLFICNLCVAFLGRFSLPRSAYVFSSFCIASVSWVRPLVVILADDDYKSEMQALMCCCKPEEAPRALPTRTPSMRSELDPSVTEQFPMPFLRASKFVRYTEDGEGILDVWENQSVA